MKLFYSSGEILFSDIFLLRRWLSICLKQLLDLISLLNIVGCPIKTELIIFLFQDFFTPQSFSTPLVTCQPLKRRGAREMVVMTVEEEEYRLKEVEL